MDPELVMLIKDLGVSGAVLYVLLFQVVPLLKRIAEGQGCRYGAPPPPAPTGSALPVLALVLAGFLPAILMGCGSMDGVRRHAPELRRSWRMFLDASEPAPVVSRTEWQSLADSVSHGLEAVERASDE